MLGGVLDMLPAIDVARAAIASALAFTVGIIMLCKISSAPLVSIANDTSLLMPLSIAHAYG
jgi:hypothetical protein